MTEPSEKRQLIARFLTGDLSAAEKSLVLEACRKDDAFLTELADSFVVERLLRFRGVSSSGRVFTSEVIQRLDMITEPEWAAQILKKIETETATIRRRRRRQVMRFSFGLAAAASLLVCAGVYLFLHRSVPTRMFPCAVRIVGDVNISRGHIATGTGSYCNLQYSDGTSLVLDQNTRLSLIPESTSFGKRIELHRGRTYLDVTDQRRPLVVTLRDSIVEVLGTRLVVAISSKPRITVLNGRVKLRHGTSGVYATQGQTILPPVGRQNFVNVLNLAAGETDISWLRKVGVDTVELLMRTREKGGQAEVFPMGFANHSVSKGLWRMERENRDVIVTREETDGAANILLGEPVWEKGRLSCRFKVLKRGHSPVSAGFSFFNDDGLIFNFGMPTALNKFLDSGHNGWINMRTEFELNKDGVVVLRKTEMWPDQNGSARVVTHEWTADRRVKMLNGCGVGLYLEGCSAKFSNLTFIQAKRHERAAVRSGFGRVTDGLLALYLFNEGEGQTIRDVSGVGEPLDLTILHPEKTLWLQDGLRVTGAACITHRGNTAKILKAWGKNKAYTIEAWLRLSENQVPDPQGTNRKFMRLSFGTQARIWWYSAFIGHAENRRLVHNISIGADIEKRLTGSYWDDGKWGNTTKCSVSLLHFLRQRPLEILFAPPEDKDAKWNTPWEGDIFAIAIYGRALSEEEVRRNFVAGAPGENPASSESTY